MVLVIKNLPACAGDIREVESIPGSGRFPGGGHGNPLQCSCLENPVDRGAWRATVHGVTKSWTRLSNSAHMHLEGEWDEGCLGNLIQPVSFKMPLTTENRALRGWFSDCSLR